MPIEAGALPPETLSQEAEDTPTEEIMIWIMTKIMSMNKNITMIMKLLITMEGMISQVPLEQGEPQALQGTKKGTRGKTQGMVIATEGNPPMKITGKIDIGMAIILKEAQVETGEGGSGAYRAYKYGYGK